MTIGGIATTKETHHDRSHPGRALKPALYPRVLAPASASSEANSDTGFGGEETSPSRSRRNASAKAIASAHSRMCVSRPSAEHPNGMKIEPPMLVIARFMRATQLDHPDKPGDDNAPFRLQVGLCPQRPQTRFFATLFF